MNLPVTNCLSAHTLPWLSLRMTNGQKQVLEKSASSSCKAGHAHVRSFGEKAVERGGMYQLHIFKVYPALVSYSRIT